MKKQTEAENLNDIFFWGFLLMAVLAIVCALYRNHIKTQRSERTTRDVAQTLRSMALLREWKVLDGVTLSDKKGDITVDHVVVGPFGVLVLTDIHRQGGYYGELRDEQWVLSTGGENKVETVREKVPSPTRNNERFVAALRALLTSAGVYNVPVDALCPITQKEAEVFVTGASGLTVEPGRLRDRLNRPKYQKDNGVDTEKIAALLGKK